MADREVEEAADERDRQKEVEQLEAARRKLIEEGDPNAESVILQMEQKMQEHLVKRLDLNAKSPKRRHSRRSSRSPSSSVENSPGHRDDEQSEEHPSPGAPTSGFVDAGTVEV